MVPYFTHYRYRYCTVVQSVRGRQKDAVLVRPEIEKLEVIGLVHHELFMHVAILVNPMQIT